jgi:transposase-like protein
MFKGRQFDRSVILLCVRWYLTYSLSLRNLEEMMAERGITVDHATIHRWTVHYAPLFLERFNSGREPSRGGGMSMRPMSKSAASGGISTVPSIATVIRWSSGSASGAILRLPNDFCTGR